MKNFKTNYSTLLCSLLTKQEENAVYSSVCIEKNKEWYKWKIQIK